MLRRLGIRGKVLAALSVPVLVLFLLAGVVSLDAVQQVRTAREMTSLLGALQESREIVLALQAERRAALDFVALGPAAQQVRDDAGVTAGEKAQAELESARSVTADTIATFDAAAAEVNFDVLDPAVLGSVEAMKTDLEVLTDIRGRTDARSVDIRPILTDYTDLIELVVVLPDQVSGALDDRPLAAVLSAHSDVTSLVEDYRVEQAFGAQVLAGARTQEEILALGTLFPATDNAHDAAQATVQALGLEDDVVVPPLGASFRNSQSYPSYRILVATGEPQNLDFIETEDWVQRSGEEIDALEPVQSELRQVANDRASATAAAATSEAILTVAAALAAVALSIVIAFSIARQIVNPLRRLTEAAGTVRDELPRLVNQVAIPGQGPDLTLTAIPVDSTDEVGQLAAAFNEVNATTIQVAQEQAALRGSIAEMFVNVARRDQVLLNRQLSFIDALERSEEDPKTLADLFRLDHLATRMRRNAESLLVLAGIETGRRLREPMPISDVIRTASSEIEHYERVQLDLPVDPLMLGHTALTAAHLLAELLENATVFSEPGTPVHVSTGIDEKDVLVTVLDQGLGMTPEELRDANSKIATTSAGDVLGSQRLGLFVVGRISARLGARVELSLGPDGRGTLVTVRMPLVLFVEAERLPFTPPSQVPTRVETFVLPEEAAEVVHEAAYAPVPGHVQDVAPGSLGSEQNPASEVDLAALTDGTTGLGLPRRRSAAGEQAAAASSLQYREADDTAAASSIPLAPQADALAGAAGSALEGEEVWTPPVIEPAAPLSARRPASSAPDAPAAASGLPSRAPASGLPSREPAAPAASAAPAVGLPTRQASGGSLPTRQPSVPTPMSPPQTGSTPTVPDVDTRASMFSGFRSRRAELAAAAIRIEHGDDENEAGTEGSAPEVPVDGAERLAAAAAFFGRSGAPVAPAAAEPAEEPAPMVIPGLVDDDEEYGDPVFAPGASAAVVESPVYESQPFTVQAEAAAEPEAQVAEPQAVEEPAAPAAPVAQRPYLGRHAYIAEEAAPEGTWTPAPSTGSHVFTPEDGLGPQPQAEPPAPVWDPTQPVAFADEPDQPTWEQPAADEQLYAAAEPSPYDQAYTQPAYDEAAPAGGDWAAYEQPAAAAEGQQQEVPWPPAPVAEPEPAVAQAPSFEAPAAPAVWVPVTADGPVAARVDAPSAPAKRWWQLGRKRKAEAAPAVAAPIITPAPVQAPVAELPSVAPVRQSAWNASEGAHTIAPEPVAEAPASPYVGAPAAFEPAGFEPAGFEPAAFEPVADPVQPAAAEPAAFQPGQDVPTPWQPSQPSTFGSAPAPQPVGGQPAWEPPPAPVIPAGAFEGNGDWAPTQAWGAPAPVEPSAAAPAAPVVPSPALPARGAFSPQTTFTPEPAGGFDDQVTNALAQNADIASQALAELSQLSSYRPKAVSAGAPSSLVRRTPGNIPAAPAIELPKNGQRVDRDANQVRSLLSSFQSGTSRGRQAGTPGDDAPAPQNPDGESSVGNEDGSANGRGEPVTTPNTDLNQRSTSW